MKTRIAILLLAFVTISSNVPVFGKNPKPATVKLTPAERRDASIAKANATYEKAIAHQKEAAAKKVTSKADRLAKLQEKMKELQQEPSTTN